MMVPPGQEATEGPCNIESKIKVWKLGDSCHQNGCWNMTITVEKDALLHFKHRHAFESTDFD